MPDFKLKVCGYVYPNCCRYKYFQLDRSSLALIWLVWLPIKKWFGGSFLLCVWSISSYSSFSIFLLLCESFQWLWPHSAPIIIGYIIVVDENNLELVNMRIERGWYTHAPKRKAKGDNIVCSRFAASKNHKHFKLLIWSGWPISHPSGWLDVNGTIEKVLLFAQMRDQLKGN